MASTYLSRTGISGANQKKWTFSGWFKKASNGSELRLLTSSNNSSYDDNIRFDSTDKLRVKFNNATVLLTNRLFKDNNAYYHILVKVDTDQSTANDRIVLYINGVDERTVGGYSTDSMPNQGVTGYINYNAFYIGVTNPTANSNHFNGIMSHVHFTDGYAYDASAFGETDSTTGEWKIKTSPSVSYGTTGFWILKDGNTITDQSGNSNNFTVSGDLTKTEDCPSNIYATANPLVRNQVTITTANLTVRSPGSTWMGIPATLGVESGKWYWEYKLALGNAWSQCGVMSSKPNGGYDSIYSTYVGNNSGGLALNSGNGDFYHDGSSGAYGTSAWFSGGLAEYDIIGVALDATNNKIWFSQNGTWGNSSNPSTGSGGIDFSGDTDFTNYKPYFPAFSVHNCILTLNFGNGHLGTAEITTNGGNGFQDTDGNGRFYYAVPTNYRGLSTKGLNA